MGSLGKYIGLQYKNLGRDLTGVDCYGLVYLIFKNERNIELPDFTDIKYNKDWYKRKENHILENIWDRWIEVPDTYKRYDILLMKLGTNSIVNHCGMIIGDNKFIHIYERERSRVDKLEGSWKEILYKVFRWKVD